jgi:hypothetical protein
MPMREELFIPEGHPLGPGRSPTHPWRRVLDDPYLNVITMFWLTGLLIALYMATHFPLPEEIWAALITTT